jgi:hypothetical protein
MPRVKEIILAVGVALALAAGVAANPAAQSIAGQRLEVEDFSSIRAALKENPELETGVQVAGARRRLGSMF